MKLSEPQALNRVAAYCSRAERSEFAVRKKLLAWELPPDAIERIMDRLRKEKYLDNTRFARSFINDKLKFNKWGKTKIIFELRTLNISESIYNPILEDLAGDELFIRKKILQTSPTVSTVGINCAIHFKLQSQIPLTFNTNTFIFFEIFPQPTDKNVHTSTRKEIIGVPNRFQNHFTFQ